MSANFYKKLVPVFRNVTRTLAKAPAKKPAPKEVVGGNFAKLKAIQKRYACDDGTPVWLKNGASDKYLYQLSCALVLIQVLFSINVVVQIMRRDLGLRD